MTKKQKLFSLALFTIFIWASAFPITKIVQTHFSPFSLSFLRCLFAAIFLLILGFFNHNRLPQKKDIPLFCLAGFLGFTVYMITFNMGITTLTSATSSIVISLTPIFVAIGAAKIYKESISPIGWGCILAAFLGVLVLLLWDGVLSINVGILWSFCASIVFCGYNLMTRMFTKRGYTSLEIATYSMCFGALFLSIWSFDGVREFTTAQPEQIIALLYLAAVPSALGYFSWGKAMAFAERTSEVTNFMFLTPLLSTVMGFLFLKEIPNMGTFIGGLIIIVSLVLFNKKGK